MSAPPPPPAPAPTSTPTATPTSTSRATPVFGPSTTRGAGAHQPHPRPGRGASTAEGRPWVRLLRRHPLAVLLGWFFTVGQAMAFVPVFASWQGWDLPRQPFVVASTLVGLLLPALVVTRVADGREGLARVLLAARPTRLPAAWWGLALVVVPALGIAGTVFLAGAPEASPGGIASAVLVGFVTQLVLVLLTTNLWEEVVWTGVVQSRLQRRHRPVTAATVTGFLFALQHVSLVAGAPIAQALVLLVLLGVLSVPFRFLVGWLFARTGSLFLVGLLHAAGNAVAGGSGFATGLLPRLYPHSALATSVHLFAFALVGLVVLAATRARLGAPSRRRP